MVHTVDRSHGVRPNQTSSSPDTLALSAPGCSLTTFLRGPIHCEPNWLCRSRGVNSIFSMLYLYDIRGRAGRQGAQIATNGDLALRP
jgi:hypothetical protein